MFEPRDEITVLGHDQVTDAQIGQLKNVFEAEQADKYLPTLLKNGVRAVGRGCVRGVGADAQLWCSQSLGWKEHKLDNGKVNLYPVTDQSQVVVGKGGKTYVSRKETSDLHTGPITIQYGNCMPHEVARNEYAPRMNWKQLPRSERDVPPYEHILGDTDGAFDKFLNADRFKAAAFAANAPKWFPALWKECGKNPEQLEACFLNAQDRASDKSASRKKVESLTAEVMAVNFAAGNNDNPPHEEAPVTTQYLKSMEEYYTSLKQTDPQKSAEGLEALAMRIKPALDESLTKPYPKMINTVQIEDSNGTAMTLPEVDQLVHWQGAVVDFCFDIVGPLRIVPVGEIVHFAPEIRIKSVQIWRNGVPRNESKKRVFSATQLLASMTSSPCSQPIAGTTATSDDELMQTVDAVEAEIDPDTDQSSPKKKRRQHKSKKTKHKTPEFVDAD